MKTHEITLRVRYAETDAMRVVYYSNYLVYFEVGRTEFTRQMGLRYAEWERHGRVYLAVVEATCRYRRPARYDDLLILRTTLAEVRSRSMVFTYELVNAETGKAIADGRTAHVCIDEEGHAVEIPPAVRAALVE